VKHVGGNRQTGYQYQVTGDIDSKGHGCPLP
jgi:hypothetical protein